MLSPIAEEIVPAHNRAGRGRRREEKQDSSNSELFSLPTEMRKEIKKRDEWFKEELRWRDEIMVVDNKAREENLEALIQ